MIEWVGVLKAVESAGPDSVCVELGAGWGPWIVSSGVAAKRMGRTVRLYGVEADPDKVLSMQEHLSDNGFSPNEYRIVNGIAGPVNGKAYFPIIDSKGNWGGAAVWEPPGLGQYRELDSITLSTMLEAESLVDLIHIDIQGAESEVVRASIEFLNDRVRWLVIGTHSRKIEANLMDVLFPAWTLENEQPARCRYEGGRSIIIVDGTQVWRNRAL